MYISSAKTNKSLHFFGSKSSKIQDFHLKVSLLPLENTSDSQVFFVENRPPGRGLDHPDGGVDEHGLRQRRRRGVHGGVGVPQDHWAVGQDEIDVLVAFEIGDVRPGRARDMGGCAPHGLVGAHGTVDPAGDRPSCSSKMGLA